MITPPSHAQDGFVAFVTQLPAPHFLEPGQRLDSTQASMRLRVGIPASVLAHQVPVWLVPPETLVQDPTLAALGRVRGIAVGKLPVRYFAADVERARDLLDAIEDAAESARVLVDFSDDLNAAADIYAVPFLREVQQRLLATCTATVPTEALRAALLPQARHGVIVIEDPYESAEASTPRFEPGETLKLAWFGVFGAAIRPHLERELATIARRLAPRPVELAFVTFAHEAPLVAEMAAVLRAAHSGFTVRHVPWSVPATAAEIDRADVIVIPQDVTSAWGRVKSHNRLVEAIRGGRFAAASPLAAYRELAEYAWIGDDLATGIEWALANPRDAVGRIAAGQRYVAERFSPPRIGALWASALGL